MRSFRKDISVFVVSVRVMKMSSMYLVTVCGWMGCVSRKGLMMKDIKMLAIVRKAIVIAREWVCVCVCVCV